MVLDYKIIIKDTNNENASILTHSAIQKHKCIKSLLFTKKHIMQSLLKKLQTMGIEYQKDDNFESFKPILQFFILIIDLCKNYSLT